MVRFWKLATMSLLVITLAGLLFPSLSVAADDGAPVIPHDVSGKEQCLTCHSAGGFKPVPASHANYNDSSCLSCHTPAAVPPATITDGEISDADNACLLCHGQPDLSMTLADGETLSLYVEPGMYAASVHGDKLLCTDCHTSITGYPHAQWNIPSRRAYSIAQYELCKRCHFDNYTKTLDSIHYQILSSGDLNAPLCTDCHGAHNVTQPSQPRTRISQTCSRCHQDIYQQYINSVHGEALIEDNNYDVPVCTDCHQTHTIEDPTTASFRLESVHLCSNCHSNKALMDKYGISADVVNTYLNDFHGRSVALVEQQARDIWVQEAVCTDCHGIHDIQMVDSPNSPVIKENLAATCGKCHAGATPNFPGAWLSHYEPTIDKAPLVFFVIWFYRILIPFIIAGLCALVLLDLWRRITNR